MTNSAEVRKPGVAVTGDVPSGLGCATGRRVRGQQVADVGPWVADGAHFPVEDGADRRPAARCDDHVPEPVVTVDDNRAHRFWYGAGQPRPDLADDAGAAGWRSLPRAERNGGPAVPGSCLA